ncbi:7087_t:CDS:2 [Entrophospora sp. SA101]|nr:7087_t:CDS:2 [Entrophospora sp. SA101]
MSVLSELAAKLMSIPALLAAPGRNWSHLAFESKERNEYKKDSKILDEIRRKPKQ